jgi:hypothetical protein
MDTIQQLLGSNYCMFYHPGYPVAQLSPVQTLDRVIVTVNYCLQTQGRDLSVWHHGAQDEIARLLWVNWFYQQLAQEPIRKPILVHEDHSKLIVDCGDTRLMAVSLRDANAAVPVMITTRLDQTDRYTDWIQIYCAADLISLLDFDQENCQIFYTPTQYGSSHAVSWLEISDPSTVHHLHDVGMRLNMMQNYLGQQSVDFVFGWKWCVSRIEWSRYQ